MVEQETVNKFDPDKCVFEHTPTLDDIDKIYSIYLDIVMEKEAELFKTQYEFMADYTDKESKERKKEIIVNDYLLRTIVIPFDTNTRKVLLYLGVRPHVIM